MEERSYFSTVMRTVKSSFCFLLFMTKTEQQRVILLSTGAIGDMVIASALAAQFYQRDIPHGIVSAGFTLPLWNHFRLATLYVYNANKNVPELPSNAFVVDIRNYLRHFPHSSPLPNTNRKGHLCEWMAVEALATAPSLERLLENDFSVSRDDVQIFMTQEEIQAGLDWASALQREHGNKPVVIISPYSTTVNRNIGKQRLDEVVYGLRDSVLACQLTPLPEGGAITGAVPVGSTDLRKVAGLLLAADAYLGVDSGPLHMVNGVIQGTDWYGHNLPTQRKKEKIFVVHGSSSPEVVAYEGNTILQAPVRVCDIAPCGAHGYVAPEAYGERFGKQFHHSPTDKGGCVFQDHHYKDTAACMTAVSSEQIIEAVRSYLQNRT